MKFIFITLFTFIFSLLLRAQSDTLVSIKTQLDTTVFNTSMYERIFGRKDSPIQTNSKYLSILNSVATYNSYVGQKFPSEIITVKFNFSKNKLNSLKFFFNQTEISFISIESKIKNGFVIILPPAREGNYYKVALEQYRNNQKNGFSVNYEYLDSFTLKKQYYHNDKPTGKSFSYYLSGHLKEEGDSSAITKIHVYNAPFYDRNGTLINYIQRESYDLEKKGNWKYYNEKGELVNQIFFK